MIETIFIIFSMFVLYCFIIHCIGETKKELIKHIRASDVILKRIEAQARRNK